MSDAGDAGDAGHVNAPPSRAMIVGTLVLFMVPTAILGTFVAVMLATRDPSPGEHYRTLLDAGVVEQMIAVRDGGRADLDPATLDELGGPTFRGQRAVGLGTLFEFGPNRPPLLYLVTDRDPDDPGPAWVEVRHRIYHQRPE